MSKVDSARGEVAELQRMVANATKILPVGNRTKSAMSVSSCVGVQIADVTTCCGIVSYDPSEFLISARAGTTIAEIESALAEHGQFLPFDPLFASPSERFGSAASENAALGATLGGTVASGISGSQRMLYGGLRDFVMEVELIDGLGQLVRGGGKVVKNAAGFDLPKMVVGSYGRLGILVEVTLKVLPKPSGCRLLAWECGDVQTAVSTAQRMLGEPLPVGGMDFNAQGQLHVALSAPEESLDDLTARCARLVHAEPAQLSTADVQSKLTQLWTVENQQFLIRAATDATTISQTVSEVTSIAGCEVRSATGAGASAWILADGTDAMARLGDKLAALKTPSMVVLGPTTELTCLGDTSWTKLATRIQLAMDPAQKFLPYGG